MPALPYCVQTGTICSHVAKKAMPESDATCKSKQSKQC